MLLSAASAQSFNIDLDIGSGSANIGAGAPSPSFGGAANSPGFWNDINGGDHGPRSLSGLDGSLTSAQISASGGIGSYGGYNNPLNTGDYALLLNDSADVGVTNFYHFSGFAPGHYLLFTYAVKANAPNVACAVTVPGADVPVQTVAGPMPGNAFILGVTHCLHDLILTGDSFEIDVSSPGPPTGQVNGFQIVAVPEPTTVFVCLIGMVSLFRRRKRPM